MPRSWERDAARRQAKRHVSSAWDDLSISPRRSAVNAKRWMPAPGHEKLAAQPTEPRPAEIELPGLPPLSDEERTSYAVARRSAVHVLPAPDARDRRREAFAAAELRGDESERAASVWAEPESLYAQLTALTRHVATAAWANEALTRVHRLGKDVETQLPVTPALATLRATVEEVDPLASRLGDASLATQLRQAGYAIRRRVDVWERLLESSEDTSRTAAVDMDRVRLAIADVEDMTRDSDHGRAWRDYLLLDALEAASRGGDAAGVEGPALARRILGRVAVTPLSESQEQFLASEPMDRLAVELRRMAAGEPDRASLLAAMERYEQTRSPSDARRLADECMWLGYRSEPPVEDLQRRITMHYRNANLRVEATESFLNRTIPERLPEYAPVRDTILGNPVRGQSLTAADVAVRLIPDPSRIRLALEISGEVAALTSSKNGPAVFQNTSESRYRAIKPIELSVDGLTLQPAEVDEVNNVTRLQRLQTSFDGIPILGALVQNVARAQHDMKRYDVRREVERKVAARATQKIDDEASERLGEASNRLRQRVLEPMHGLSLGPHMIEASTTEERLTMRLRVGSARQLGAHTPRPKSPEDSLLSVQVHQTAMNNLVERLTLDGKTFTLAELRLHLARRLNLSEIEETSDENDDVRITFADKDAVRITCDKDQVTIDLSVAELSRGSRVWQDFEVRACYRPRVEGLSAELVRDGVVRLPGGHVRSNAQIPLRGIFSKVFSKNKNYQLVPDRIRESRKMEDLAVTQMTIEDGWVALAIGPKPRLAQAGERETK
ncbi:MAG TPA: hypothetical protein VJL29_09390 [Thermoguttaceae bacterium]|nr:hypothetical protein [Thermoguttaceae bacterium]